MQAPALASVSNRYALAAIAWALFIAYGSLVPLEFQPRPDAWNAFLAMPYLNLGVGSRADWIANILLYLVLGYLAMGAIRTASSGLARELLSTTAVLACLVLAVAIEYAQLYFPPRTVSLNDLIAELIGTLLGCAGWFAAGSRLHGLWDRFLAGSAYSFPALLSLYAVAYLALSLFPYDFLISISELRDKIAHPGAISLATMQACTGSFSCGAKLLSESVLTMPIGMLLAATTQRWRGSARQAATSGFVAGCALGAAIEAIQLFLASGTTVGFSILTRGVGTAWGAGLAANPAAVADSLNRGTTGRMLLAAAPLYAGLLLAINDIVPLRLDALWAARERLADVNFLPFYYHYYTSETVAVRSLLVVAGSYAPIGIAAALLPAGTRRRTGLWVAVTAAVAGLTIEALKLFGSAKHTDPTNVMIAAASAWLTWRLVRRLRGHVSASFPQANRVPHPAASLRSFPRWGIIAPVALIALVAALAPRSGPVQAQGAGAGNTFPPPEALAPVTLPGFRNAHPRLPHPTLTDLRALATRNPAYLEGRLAAARKGEEDASVFTAFATPGLIDLDRLHTQLMRQSFTGRGDAPVKLLAVAYDWLYDQWSYAQRIALQDKLNEGCRFVVNYIRTERLSPYNAILYNSPLQALMACSIALYGDHPAADGLMAFTHDQWKNRVLPVWRQVFGRNGGWHEGGEYVSVGIGQAVYTLPAMWEAATGERIFDAEAGLPGFLDFLIYRTQPDGTQFRWGDGAYFGRNPVDGIPLAIRYRNAAAYTLLTGAQPPGPSGWPWGPLTDASLVDSSAGYRLPLTRLFDGIGLVVARSDWGPDATYVTFKAGDNYWSHSHLDQGAFTIYKGGPLAIDSGVYGPHYGSEHHLNYAYQTIAHNTVTVTDPADDTPMQRPDAVQRIANDGGQRRVGSSWGLSAPLDRQEWEAQGEIYHTGKIVRYWEQGPLTVAVADLTPAYTNSHSQKGEFAQRTRRVEHAWRVFAYDRSQDVIVIYDDILASSPSFRKRWLMHTINEPRLAGSAFTVTTPAEGRHGRSGGRLEGQVLLPVQSNLLSIGGPGFEFFVDGRNYDEDGKLLASLRKGEAAPEPGNWRIEISPARESAADQFLVALRPTLANGQASREIQPLAAGNEVGCEVPGRERSVRFWFTPGKLGVRIEEVIAGKTSEVRLEPDTPLAASESAGLFARLISLFNKGSVRNVTVAH